MFTGIIEDLGVVKLLEKRKIYKLAVEALILEGQKIGDSISVNGVCLTISESVKRTATFDIMDETIKKSNLGNLKIGEKVNLERALKIGGRLGGHFVTGHIDCVGRIIENSDKMKVEIQKEDSKYVVQKGSIALDGVSLTIADIGTNNLTVYLIPHTSKTTNLGFKKAGDSVNVEFDLLGKYALRLKSIETKESRVTEGFLRKTGFVKT